MEGGAVNLYKDFFPTSLHVAPKIIVNVWSLSVTLGTVAVLLVIGMIAGFLLAIFMYDPMFFANLWRVNAFSNSGKDSTSSVTTFVDNNKNEVENGNRSSLMIKKVNNTLLLDLILYQTLNSLLHRKRYPNMLQLSWTETDDTVPSISRTKQRFNMKFVIS